MTTLEEATGRVLNALRDEDLAALGRALEERGRLVADGAEVTQEAWDAGETAREALGALKLKVALESARLEQIRTGVAETLSAASETRFDVFG
jgi:hypothetical protein